MLGVFYPVGINNSEDNYASGMYIFKAKTVVELKDTLYFYRRNLSGLNTGIMKRPFDLLIALIK